jgi:7-cyano-7-deazaguanine synthase
LKKAVVILSGGLDSSTCLYIAKSEGYELYVLTFRYGQRHEIEIEKAIKIASIAEVKEHRIIELPTPKGSALTDDIEVPKGRSIEELSIEIPPTYVPARNTLFIAYALQYAEEIGAEAIFTGLTSTDASPYPDTRPEYVEAYQKLINLATAQTVNGKGIELKTPLLHLYKSETISIGMDLGVPYGDTWSCYSPEAYNISIKDENAVLGWKLKEVFRPCLTCDTCKLRTKGFIEAGYKDPAVEEERWEEVLKN